MSLKNPYSSPPPGQSNHLLTSRVSPDDFNFLQRQVPYTFGISDIVVSILFKKLIDELRNQHATNPFPPTLHVGDANYLRIERILEQCNFRDDSGRSGARDVERGAGGLREEVQSVAEQRTDAPGGTTRRQRGKGKSKSEGEKK